MKKLASEFVKILFDKFIWFVASLCILAITFGANLNSRVNALESSKESAKEVDKLEKAALLKSIQGVDTKVSKILCMFGEKSEC